jgi:alpha-1,4-digalacturonate transport system substrate-binding protein
MNKRIALSALVSLLVFIPFLSIPAAAQDEPVELRFVWYEDGNEGEVIRDLLDRFEAENPDIRVILDTLPYADLHTSLQTQVESGTPPDLARVNDVARFHGQYLELNDLVPDAEYWTTNFADPVLDSLREDTESDAVYGFPLQFTVTIPFVNKTLFDQAGVELLGPEATWQDWVEAAKQVAEATETPYTVAIDRTGHRFWGFSLVQGATFINPDGGFTVDTPGFRAAAEELISWNQDGITPLDVWAGSGGAYVAATEYFINGQVPLYYAGTWQIGNFTNAIGDTFDWQVIPNPSGEAPSTGVPGGSLIVGFAGSEHPAEVARVLDYLVQADVLREFAERTLFVPGHLGLVAEGIEWPANAEALNVALSEIPKITPEAYGLQYSPFSFPLNTAIRDRLSQVIVGEITLDEAIELIQSDIDTVVDEASAS